MDGQAGRGRAWAEIALAWGLSLAMMMAAAAVAGVPVFAADSYGRYDSGHYLGIAREGYVLTDCRDVPAYPPEAWCGNAGWFPGYPLLIRGLGFLPLSAEAIGFGIANLASLLSLALLRALAVRMGQGAQAGRLLLLGAFFPGGLYAHAIFPISLLLCCMLAALLMLERGQVWRAAGAAAVGAFFYSTGFLASAVVGAGVLLRGTRWPWPQRFAVAVACGLLAFAGMAAVLIMHQALLGHWNAFFLVQAKMGHGLHNPFAVFPAMVVALGAAGGEVARMLAPAQTLVVGALMAALLLSLLARWRRVTPMEVVLAALGLVFWIFPLVMGLAVSLTRAEALLMPLVLLLGGLPRGAHVALLGLFVLLRFVGALAFFDAVLI